MLVDRLSSISLRLVDLLPIVVLGPMVPQLVALYLSGTRWPYAIVGSLEGGHFTLMAVGSHLTTMIDSALGSDFGTHVHVTLKLLFGAAAATGCFLANDFLSIALLRSCYRVSISGISRLDKVYARKTVASNALFEMQKFVFFGIGIIVSGLCASHGWDVAGQRYHSQSKESFRYVFLVEGGICVVSLVLYLGSVCVAPSISKVSSSPNAATKIDAIARRNSVLRHATFRGARLIAPSQLTGGAAVKVPSSDTPLWKQIQKRRKFPLMLFCFIATQCFLSALNFWVVDILSSQPSISQKDAVLCLGLIACLVAPVALVVGSAFVLFKGGVSTQNGRLAIYRCGGLGSIVAAVSICVLPFISNESPSGAFLLLTLGTFGALICRAPLLSALVREFAPRFLGRVDSLARLSANAIAGVLAAPLLGVLRDVSAIYNDGDSIKMPTLIFFGLVYAPCSVVLVALWVYTKAWVQKRHELGVLEAVQPIVYTGELQSLCNKSFAESERRCIRDCLERYDPMKTGNICNEDLDDAVHDALYLGINLVLNINGGDEILSSDHASRDRKVSVAQLQLLNQTRRELASDISEFLLERAVESECAETIDAVLKAVIANVAMCCSADGRALFRRRVDKKTFMFNLVIRMTFYNALSKWRLSARNIPRKSKDVTPAWMNRCFQAYSKKNGTPIAFGGRKVVEVQTKPCVGGKVAATFLATLVLDDGNLAKVVVKLGDLSNVKLMVVSKLMNTAETEFETYRYFGSKEGAEFRELVRVPTLHGGYTDDSTGNYAFVLSVLGSEEGMPSCNGRFEDGVPDGISREKFLDAIRMVARLHAFHWGKPKELRESSPHRIFRVLDTTKWYFHMVYKRSWESAIERYDAVGLPLPPKIRQLGDVLCLEPAFNQAIAWSFAAPTTVLHGDLSPCQYHICVVCSHFRRDSHSMPAGCAFLACCTHAHTEPENMFFVDTESQNRFGHATALIDFANLSVGCGPAELPMFFSRSIKATLLRSCLDETIDAYHGTLLEHGVEMFSREDVWESIRAGVLLTWAFSVAASGVLNGSNGELAAARELEHKSRLLAVCDLFDVTSLIPELLVAAGRAGGANDGGLHTVAMRRRSSRVAFNSIDGFLEHEAERTWKDAVASHRFVGTCGCEGELFQTFVVLICAVF